MGMEHDDISQRILGCMRRAPGGKYTAIQLARSVGLSVPKVQRGLTDLERAGAIVRAPQLPYPAYCLARETPASVPTATQREAADRERFRRIA